MRTENESDLAIISRVVDGGRHADYAILVNRYKTQLFAFVATMVAEREEAEELSQDCFVRAFQRLGQYDERQGAFYTWLRGIAYRICVNHLHRRPEAWLETDELMLMSIPDDDAERVMETDDDARIALLVEGIKRLPPTERMLVQQHYFDGQPLKEIAQVTDTDSGTLATRLHRIRKKLHLYIVGRMNIKD